MTDEGANLIVEQLKLLRGDFHELRLDVNRVEGAVNQLRVDVDERIDQTNARIDLTNMRLEVVETVVRDSAQQLVVLARVHTLLQNRRNVEGEIDDLKQRVTA